MSRLFLTTEPINEYRAADYIKEHAYPLKTSEDFDPLMERIGDARIVMLGEASHGTHEYYTWRSQISQRLIKEKGFNFIAVEGDWPDCYKLNRFVKNYTNHQQPFEILKEFNRWPTWMWANWEISALAAWLHHHNQKLSREQKVGFYGLDMYSLWESMQAVMDYLEKNDPNSLLLAQKAFSCFEPYRDEEGLRYAHALRLVPEICEGEVMRLLVELQLRLPQYNSDYENVFSLEQNTLVTVNAEKYYRAMLEGGGASWNARDSHMEETLERLLDFHGAGSKAIVWEHNTHIGDASATDMADTGMYNVGQLARQHFGKEEVVLVGFGSYEGSVVAGSHWGDEMRVKRMPEANKNSWEYMLHAAGAEDKLLLMHEFEKPLFTENYIGHRAIGVVYNPNYEHYGNYVPSLMPRRYDAFLYIDQTRALHPMHIQPDGQQTPETYPFGM